MNKRELLQAQLRLQAGIKRLQDMKAVFPEARHSLDGVMEMDFAPALDSIKYVLSLME